MSLTLPGALHSVAKVTSQRDTARMRRLNFELERLQETHPEGSRPRRRERFRALALAADTLHDLGFRGLRAKGLGGRHVEALMREWRRRGLSTGTIRNRLGHLRWWARKIGRPGVVRSNAGYGIGTDVT